MYAKNIHIISSVFQTKDTKLQLTEEKEKIEEKSGIVICFLLVNSFALK